MSHTSKIAIGAPVGLRRPLMESGERVVDRFPLCLGQDHVVALDPISELIALAHMEGGSDRLRNRRLGLAGDLARDQGCYQDVACHLICKDFPYYNQACVTSERSANGSVALGLVMSAIGSPYPPESSRRMIGRDTDGLKTLIEHKHRAPNASNTEMLAARLRLS